MGFVCPWWGGYFIDNPLRRLIHDPAKIVGPYVRPGMTVMDVGCGMGFFAIAMARMVGETGRVIAVDLQQKMLDVLNRRAARAGLAQRIRTHRCQADVLGIHQPVDFALAFAVVHEVPDVHRFLGQVHSCLRAEAKLLVAEPRLHVSGRAFQAMVALAEAVGLEQSEQPVVRWCRAMVFVRR